MKELKKILICEDEEILLTALKFRLQKQGYELTLSDNGESGKAAIQHDRPDIIVTDIDLPDVSGIDMVNYVRNELHEDIPIILITPLDNEQAILEAMLAGASDFVTKPFKPVELVLRIRCIFQQTGS
jgi:two-component system response regulator VicR